MKCEHCGKNEVSFVYQSNINGKVTEKHLCAECAQKLGLTQKLAARQQRMMRGFFDDGFFGGSLLEDFFSPAPRLLGGMDRFFGEDLFDDFFSAMPALSASPAAEKAAGEKPEQKEDLVGKEEQGRFARLRQMNALRMELKRAVHEQNFEHAAEVRDQIRAMEREHKDGNKE